MSRCFRFPPPGYEKKARIDDTNLLIKETHKEKKHKKDKKEKEKREGKDKNDKDRSKEKHREKKDRKEKHKDKDKDKEKDKDKTRISDEKRVDKKTALPNEEKFGPNGIQSNEISDSKYVQELARRIKDEDRTSGSEMLQRNPASDQRGAGLFGKPLQYSIGKQSEEKDGVRLKDEDRRKAYEQKNHIFDRGLGREFGGPSLMDKEKVEGIPMQVEEEPDKQVDGKEKTKNKDSNVKGEKHKSKDRDKDRKSRYKDQNKEKKEGKMKEITERSKEQTKLREGGMKLKENSKDSLDSQRTNSLDSLKLSSPGSASEGNLGKRKEFEPNGYLLDNGNRLNKFLRPISSSTPTVENGRTLISGQTPIPFASEEQGAANSCKAEIARCKINGLMEAQNQNGEAPAKPPHPDTKYLSQILSIPTVEELPDFDDQEWLFSSNTQLKRSDRNLPGVDETQQVWAEARRIESADISALPYVIPY